MRSATVPAVYNTPGSMTTKLVQGLQWVTTSCVGCRGAYKPIPDSYSADLQRLVAALLEKDPRARPAAAAILARPYVRRHVQVQRRLRPCRATCADRIDWLVVPMRKLCSATSLHTALHRFRSYIGSNLVVPHAPNSCHSAGVQRTCKGACAAAAGFDHALPRRPPRRDRGMCTSPLLHDFCMRQAKPIIAQSAAVISDVRGSGWHLVPQAAQWEAVMATEPPAAAEPPEPSAAADGCPVADLAAELAAADNDLARMPNPFGTPSCDLLSLLIGTASGSLSSHGSKSSAGEDWHCYTNVHMQQSQRLPELTLVLQSA
jgi:hypothetical protein